MINQRTLLLAAGLLSLVGLTQPVHAAQPLDWIVVSADKKDFVYETSGKVFQPRGFNYDRDHAGRLLEDYWEEEWSKVEQDFAEMRELGANAVRIHLQFGKFMDAPDKPNASALEQLSQLVKLAEREQLYLDLTGLGCYHKADVPKWYDELDEAERWGAQANFWRAIAKQVSKSSAVFCFDLMNEPVVPGGKRNAGDWLGPAFGGKHYVQVITLDQQDRPRPAIAAAWIKQLVGAIREVDKRHLVTVGLVDWSLDRPGLTSGFVPTKVTDELDFICVHLYPEKDKVDEALKTLNGFAIGKPVVVEETFPLKCSLAEMDDFMKRSQTVACGWFSFYWGEPPQVLAKSDKFGDALLHQWLQHFPPR